MPPLPTLDALADEPTPQFVVEVEGRSYSFSEVPLASLARLQAIVKEVVPHPVDAIAPRLQALAEADRRYLLDRAYDEARYWPPRAGTMAFSLALLGSPEGQVAALLEGLRVHRPDATPADADRLYQALERDAAARSRAKAPDDRKVARIFATIFGTYRPEDDRDAPKSGGGAGRRPRRRTSPR